MFRLTRREVVLVTAVAVLAGLGMASIATRPELPKPAQLTAEKGTLEEACLNGADTFVQDGKTLKLWTVTPLPADLVDRPVPGDAPEQPHLARREPTDACPNRKGILEAMEPPSEKAKAAGFARLANRPPGFVASSNCDYFVSNAGSNGAAGSFAAPWRGIATKMNLLTPGTHVCARGGTWNDWAPVDFSGISNVSLVSFECEEPTFANTAKTGGDAIIIRDSNNGILISGINFVGWGHPTYGTGTIEIGPSNSTGGNTNITIEDSTFTDMGADGLDHAVYIGANLGGQSNIIIRRNRFLTGLGGAIHSYHAPMSSAVTLEDNEITGFKWGILVSHEGYQNWTIQNNAVYNASDGGIRFGYYAESPAAISSFTITNNIAYATSGNLGALSVDQAFITDGWAARVNETANDWYRTGGASPISYGGNPASGYVSLASYQSSSGEGAGDVSVDPKFNNVTVGDLRPTPSTPASVAAMGPRYSSFPSCGTGGGGGSTMQWANNLSGIGAVDLNGQTIPSTSNFYAFLNPTPAISGSGFAWTVNGSSYHPDDLSQPYQLDNALITVGTLGCGSKTIVATELGGGASSYTATFTITCPATTTTTSTTTTTHAPTTTTTTVPGTTTTTVPPSTTTSTTTTSTTTTSTSTTTTSTTSTTTTIPIPGPFPCGFSTRLSGTSPSGTSMLDGSLATYTSIAVGGSVQFTFAPGTVHRAGVVFKANAGAQSFTVQVWQGTSATKGQWVTVAKVSFFHTGGTDKCASVPLTSVGTFGKIRMQVLAREGGTNPRVAEFAVGT